MLLLALVVLTVGVPSACANQEYDGEAHSGFVTDEPDQNENLPKGLDDSDIPSAEAYFDQQEPTNHTDHHDRSIFLVGALKGDPSDFNQHVFGDVAGYKNLAFVGKWHEGCPGTGVDIIDISRPSSPTKLSDTNDYPDTSMEDMQAIEIGGRDVLAIGLQDCGNDPAPGVGKSGLELYDVTEPTNPRFLSFFDTDAFGADSGGVHELDLA